MPTPEEIESMSPDEVMEVTREIVDEISDFSYPGSGRIVHMLEEMRTFCFLNFIISVSDITLMDMKRVVFEEDPEQDLHLQYDLAQMAGVLFSNADIAKTMPYAGRHADVRE